jgi:hypothetical protein
LDIDINEHEETIQFYTWMHIKVKKQYFYHRSTFQYAFYFTISLSLCQTLFDILARKANLWNFVYLSNQF